MFDKLYKEVNELIESGISEKEAKIKAPFFRAQKLLIKWENGDSEVYSLWKKMNDKVYDGFEDTYKMELSLINFIMNQYLSNRKEVVNNGLKIKSFIQKKIILFIAIFHLKKWMINY